MSIIPIEWGEPNSPPGVYFDLLSTGLVVVVFGALAYWQPFSITVSITPRRLAGATLLGVIFSVAMAYVSFVNERFRHLWVDSHFIRFAGIFVLIIGGQLGLAIVPTWTVLTILATFLTFIPLRVAIYLRTR